MKKLLAGVEWLALYSMFGMAGAFLFVHLLRNESLQQWVIDNGFQIIIGSAIVSLIASGIKKLFPEKFTLKNATQLSMLLGCGLLGLGVWSIVGWGGQERSELAVYLTMLSVVLGVAGLITAINFGLRWYNQKTRPV